MASWENTLERSEFESRARTQVLALQRAVDQELEAVAGIAALYESSERVELHEFATFADPLLERHQSIRAAEWVPRVSQGERADFEAQISATWQRPGLTITERRADGLHPAAPRDQYFPAAYVQPYEGNASVIGYDLASEPHRLEAIETAWRSGEVSATPPIELIQAPASGAAMLALAAVYRGDPSSTVERWETLEGFAVGVIELDTLFDTVLPATEAHGLALVVIDPTHGENVPPVYGAPVDDRPPVLAAALDVGGRNLTLSFYQQPGVHSASNRYLSGLIVFGGFGMSALLGAWLLRSRRYTLGIEALADELETRVASRTADLAAANTQLVDEMGRRERANEARLASDTRLRALLANFPGAIWTTDRTLALTSAAGGVLDPLHLSEDKVGLDLAEVLGPLDPQGAALDAHRSALAGEVVLWEVTVDDRVFEGRAEPLQDSLGGGVLAVLIDVGERRALEKARIAARLQDAQRLESLGLLAGGIAHDFNNLLVGILGQSSLALERMGADDANRESVEQIASSAERAAALTRQMLAYAGRGSFDVGPLDLSAVVDGMARLLTSSISRNTTLDLELGADLPTVEGDATQLGQVVMNLITNASDALSGAEGTVTVETSVLKPSADLVKRSVLGTLTEGRPVVCLSVTDEGGGIDDGVRQRMFDPFFSTKPTGHGLGLSAVLGIVRSHRGDVVVQSGEGAGTTVRILLPISGQPVHLPSARSSHPTPRPAPGANVLVIDDEDSVRSFVASALEMAGHTAHQAEDGTTGVVAFRALADQLDLVILDMVMPGEDGIDVLRQLRAIRPDVPVVLCSGYSKSGLDWGSGAPTPDGFLQKPYRFQQLLALVEQHRKPVA